MVWTGKAGAGRRIGRLETDTAALILCVCLGYRWQDELECPKEMMENRVGQSTRNGFAFGYEDTFGRNLKQADP